MFIARSETRLGRLARACAGLCAGRVEMLLVPPWDVLPYDRSAPSAAIVGRRVRSLVRLGTPDGLPRLLLIGADAALQRVPRASAWSDAVLHLVPGQMIAFDALRIGLGAQGYRLDETVVDPGEVAFRGQTIDLFPADADLPVRLSIVDGIMENGALQGGRIESIRRFDPASQRSLETLDGIEAFPATEFPLDPDEAEAGLAQEEAAAPLPSGRLVPVFDYAVGFGVAMDDEVPARWAELRALVDDAHEGSRALMRVEPDKRGVLPRPGRLFLSVEEAMGFCAAREAAAPVGEAEADPASAAELVRRASTAGGAVVIATPGNPARLAASLVRRNLDARAATDWVEATAGGVACMALDVEQGLRREGLLVLRAARLVRADRDGAPGPAGLGEETALRAGDVVVHEEHGAARLTGLKPVSVGAMTEERVALAFRDGSELLVEPAALDRVWRYGLEGSLDRMDGEAWRQKRGEIEAEIAVVAERLAEAAAARAACRAPVIEPPRGEYDRLSRRFAHALSVDQRAAVQAVLADLRQGRPMDRLVCGDVGFGKTEVALRAAAAVALAGWQVAVVAPTTVLARQHLETFRRRFRGTSIRVEGSIGGADGKAVRAGLADGSVGIVVGTQGLSADGVRFARLGLVVVDEEQRFGEVQKRRLVRRGEGSEAVHALAMTATPIPRTMQMAMVGLRDVSVIRTAPLRRQATRTLVLPFDTTLVRDALLREQARGGQSFVVCPRIADLVPAAAMLAEVAPGLRVVQAHGRMKAEALEEAVVGFSGGVGDVLLATNIIEAGLDIPRANTIVVMQPDRFGLAQLHQMRGRVGRGARRGTAYLLTAAGRRLTKATLARLKALESLGSLGAGVAISAADLDQRGAGEMFGDAQAGHVSAIGTELYQHLLLQAVRRREGKPALQPAATLHVGVAGLIPDTYVPEQDLRIGLYRRLSRLGALDEVDAFGAELEDRFGAVPDDVHDLLGLARLRVACAAAGVRQVELGPRGAALEAWDDQGNDRTLESLAARFGGTLKESRVVLAPTGADARARLAWLTETLSSEE